MNTRSVQRNRTGRKCMRHFRVAAIGLAALLALAISRGNGLAGERPLYQEAGRYGSPCAGCVSPISGKESDFMATTKSQDVYDPTSQPMDTKMAVVTRLATFALG